VHGEATGASPQHWAGLKRAEPEEGEGHNEGRGGGGQRGARKKN
jgi:hypothetical protein